MNLLLNLFYSIMSTIGFAVLFNVPRKSLLKAGIGGGVGWTIYYVITQLGLSIVISTLIASLTIALMGELFAVIDKQPSTLYIIPGIIPLVPGFGIYNTMLSLLEQNYEMALQNGIETIMISALIAAALTIVLSLNAYRKRRKEEAVS